jgi:hypothetical protein
MKVLVGLIDKAKDTLDEIEFYAQKAHNYRMEYRPLADTYIKVGEMHITIFNMLHERMVELIEEESKRITPPAVMLELWRHTHERLMKEFAEAKYLIEDYKKSY